MKFERGRSVKKGLGVGFDTREVTGIAYVKNISYADFGETWNWKFLSKKRKIRRMLEKLRDGKCKNIVSVSTPTGSLRNDYDEVDDHLAGKLLEFEGIQYLMPDEV